MIPQRVRAEMESGSENLVYKQLYVNPPRTPLGSGSIMVFSPGASYLLFTILPSVGLAPAVGYGIHIGARFLYGKNVHFILQSGSGTVIAATGVWIGWKLLKQFLVRKMNEKEAKRLGAVQVPRLEGSLPWNLDILHLLLEAAKTDYIGEPFINWTKQYGHTFDMKLLGEDMIWTDEPFNTKAILATDFPNYIKGESFEPLRSVLGTGVFNSDGPMWKFHRSIARPFFSRDRISDFDIFNRHCDHTILRMKNTFDKGDAIDFQDIAGRFTLDSASEFLFGQSVNSLEMTSKESDNHATSSTRFAQAFQSAQEAVASRLRRSPVWPLWEVWGDATKEHMEVVNGYINPILEAALKRKASHTEKSVSQNSENADAEGPETFLDHLVSVTDDVVVIRDQILNILIAGRDTTAATLTFAVYLLARHHDVLAQLRQEIMTTVGPTDRPTFEHIKDMKFLRAVINETLRLFPPVPFNLRTCINSTVWENPETGIRYHIPANTTALYSVFHMHRRTDLWGEDAIEFSPMRWIDSRKNYQLTNPFIFLPFQAGPRICLGQQFAYNEASFFLIRLLQTFNRIELAPECQPIRPPDGWRGAPGRKGMETIYPRADLTIYAKGGMWVRMSDEAKTDF
ncbi:hypothetical protein FRC03_000098 [Tulasnella sp. 419]|nr:hypothetical protein FRC03_000098 [Tulasnella sp. 419]